MNELYEKLLAQAQLEFAPDSKAVTKRFAELIVLKCVAIALDHDPFWGASVDQDIKRIFGVEK